MKIAIVGATGAVGQQMLQCLEERNVEGEVKLLASSRSKGKVVSYKGKDLVIEELCEDSFNDVDYALGATENDITKMWMPWAQKNHVVVVDNSSAYRLDKDVPLFQKSILKIFKNTMALLPIQTAQPLLP